MSNETPAIALSQGSPAGSLLSAVLGIVIPRRLSERFDGLAADERASLAERLDRAGAALSAADALATLGHQRDALELMWRARDALREVLRMVDSAKLSDGGRAALADARRAVLLGGEEDDYEDLRAAVVRAQRSLEGLGWSARELRRITRERRFAALASVLAIVAVGVSANSVLRAPRVTSSGQYNAPFVAEMVLDGDPATDWLLPDRTAGYLDVHLHPARHIKSLRLVNSRNTPHNDRGTREFTVEVFRGVDQLTTQVGAFANLGEVREFAINAKTDRIRINITSYHGTGGGLAEVKLD